MRKLIGWIFCLFIIIEGPWSFTPLETLEDFLARNTSMPKEEINLVLDKWYQIADQRGEMYISYDAMLEADKMYKKIKEREDKISPEIKELDNTINDLIKQLEKKK